MRLSLIFFLCLCVGRVTVTAQRGWEIGGWAGTTFYFGDLNTTYSLKRPGAGAGAVARFNFNDRLCFKMGANYGFISADDKDSRNDFERRRNAHFKSNLFDGVGQLEFNFLPYNYFDKNQHFSPYLFGGLGVYNFNPKAQYDGKWYELRPLGTEGQFRGEEYYTTQLAFVYGGGFKFALGEVWSLNIEISARKLYTDYLDDVSTVYPNMNELNKQRGSAAVALSDPSLPNAEGLKVGRQGFQRGDTRSNDMYMSVGVGLLYYFGDLRCPPISLR